MDLTRLHGQHVLPQAAVLFNPAPPFPGPDQMGCREPCRSTEQAVARLAGLVDDDHRHRPIGGASGRQPHRAAPRPLEAVTPGPVSPAPQLLTGHPASVGQWEDVGMLPPRPPRFPADRWPPAPSPSSLQPNDRPPPGAGAGCRHRRWIAAHVRSSITCNQVSLSRQGRPEPTGSGRRTVKSTGMTSLPSPMTPTSSRPSIPRRTRCSWPLHHVPTSPSCCPAFLKRRSSPTQVHGHRLRVAGLLSLTCCHQVASRS